MFASVGLTSTLTPSRGLSGGGTSTSLGAQECLGLGGRACLGGIPLACEHIIMEMMNTVSPVYTGAVMRFSNNFKGACSSMADTYSEATLTMPLGSSLYKQERVSARVFNS